MLRIHKKWTSGINRNKKAADRSGSQTKTKQGRLQVQPSYSEAILNIIRFLLLKSLSEKPVSSRNFRARERGLL